MGNEDIQLAELTEAVVNLRKAQELVYKVTRYYTDQKGVVCAACGHMEPNPYEQQNLEDVVVLGRVNNALGQLALALENRTR